MSEYQFYDFRAIDRALTKAEIADLRSISTRAVITSTSFTNHYEWGDFKANPFKLLEKYFDAFVYLANWGTREFHLRVPQQLVEYEQLKAMLSGEAAQVRKAGQHLIVGFERESEPDDLDDGTGWMGSLMCLRSELLRGDLRCLYLGWLLCVQCRELSGEELEPPVPAGLGELSAPLHSLIRFLGIDEDLVEVAASASAPLSAGPGREELTAWIRSLPGKEKDDLLVTALSERGEGWRNDLVRRFRHYDSQGARPTAATQQRTVSALLEAARARAQERTRRSEAKRAAEAARRKAEEEAHRAQYLDQLERFEAAIWSEVVVHIQKRQPNEYDKAVQLLIDLRDLAMRREQLAPFQLALGELRRKHAAKGSFLRRLAKAKL